MHSRAHIPSRVDLEEDCRRKALAAARFKVGDIVITHDPVSVLRGGRRDGMADSGWKWRIVAIDVDVTRARPVVVYAVVDDSSGGYYHQSLTEKQIARKVGTHTPKVKEGLS